MSKTVLISLLKTGLNPSALTYRGKAARYDAVAWYNPGNMHKDYLANNKLDVLLSVKTASGNNRRFLGTYRKPRTEVTNYEVDVWLLDTPAYGKQEKDVLREAVVAEVNRVIQAALSNLRVEAVRVEDHAKGNQWVLCTRIIVASKTEN